MFDQNSEILVILPLRLEYVDWPSARWMVYGDRSQPRAHYDIVSIERDSRPVGTFVFHPSRGGLIWTGDKQPIVVSDNVMLFHNNEPIAAVKMGERRSFVMVLASGIHACWSGDHYMENLEAKTWTEAIHKLQHCLYC
ncbi:hypothetical protein A3E97_03890 [Candidatus Uhrbacteria bacterium RIFCSPHIGHO2_12_FULL_47_12]|uniref:Uncharacterized protein n=1 Tax=Candidatus Uhrbacteria bacterium RIFCSPLOWO2_02_FULL_48_18 TaxID=1802408 RepID=A0A1F7V9B9_9BACT|nr:MAG: hypothetical protein A2839_03500 [Candidatus Uhrbacteria bacterium RIFCSPHIGHO2_01_FULL_47_10]OGL75837.1 MAG: hypothetical protein A3E97_03890 [Candidatus Uhrbacteria bacterium RIFCSPHIGHO2_12_FULL_47_12]OGL81946.1 MAG: hypothetical protein A3B20_02585 [Candidatus Uhrbacteria bacterium RIFCSPLOWO2_01_FULL_47_17]OGL87110.1 MAG: hypothetical protein A3I41_04180 [Candidatus Uhrbacteria bacterium RIFCSPLOWO2_02_FULL_48_18]OGL93675.1 MAG: hypothetical protein A3H12_03435 [Candidatus Uhrbacte